MRMTQVIGLSPSAIQFLEEFGAVQLVREVYADASYAGMFDDGPELYAYPLKEGGMVYEQIQATPWSSGPCIFLNLMNEDKKDIAFWTDEEMNSNT